MRVAHWLALLVVVGGATLAYAQSSRDSSAPPGSELFVWKVIPETRKVELYFSGHRIGLWDADRRTYHNIDPEGNMSGPVKPPFPIRSHPSQRTYSTKPVIPADAGKDEKRSADSSRPWYEELPEWSTYIMGGVVTLMITCIGLAVQFRKGTPSRK